MKPLILVLACFLVFACGGSKDNNQTGSTCPVTHVATTANNICLPKSWGLQEQHQIDRSDGATILVEGELPNDDAFQKTIGDRVIAGLEQTITSAMYHNPSWSNYTSTGNYQVVMIKKHATNQDGTPALITSGVQTAGTVINVWQDGQNRGGPPIIVLPQPDNVEQFRDPAYMAYLQASARHEGEHVIEYLNSLGIFLEKIGAGDVHPHWTMPDGSLLVSDLPTKCLLNADKGTAGAVAIEGTRSVVK